MKKECFAPIRNDHYGASGPEPANTTTEIESQLQIFAPAVATCNTDYAQWN
jgi:hypothetical protein